MDWSGFKILFFDLDGTLLNSQKCISEMTARSIAQCKEKGLKIGVCTSRSEINSLVFIDKIKPDVIVSSGGALVNVEGRYIAKHEFSGDETKDIIQKLRDLIGNDCEITVDTVSAHYWNYKIDPNFTEANWGDSIFSDFRDFNRPSLKICVEIQDESKIKAFFDLFKEYDCIHFSDGNWYKITKRDITKERAVQDVVSYYGYSADAAISFGDDFADIGMLKMSGLGVAMGNGLDEVKAVADIVVGTNDENGIACFINREILK